jgi:hypothetical protein
VLTAFSALRTRKRFAIVKHRLSKFPERERFPHDPC